MSHQSNNTTVNHRRSVSFTNAINLKHGFDECPKSENSSPRISKDLTPRSRETTPRENSPRKTLLKVVQKLKHKEELPAYKHPSIYPLYDEDGNQLGEFHYELFEYAMNGNIRGIKNILDTGKYTSTDKQMISKTALKYNHPDTAYFISSYH